VIRRGAQPLHETEDVRWDDDEIELPAQVEVFDPRSNQFGVWKTSSQCLEHPGVAIDPDQRDAGLVQRHGEPAGPDAQIEDGWRCRKREVLPWPEIRGVGQARVQFGKPRIRL